MLNAPDFLEETYNWIREKYKRNRGLNKNRQNENDKNEDNSFNELLARATGSCDMGMESIQNVMEMTRGKDADSKDPDMAMHHLCAFTMTVLDRLVSSTKFQDSTYNINFR